MSVAGTKNFDQPPHDSNRTHLVFSTSGLLLGSRAPLVSTKEIEIERSHESLSCAFHSKKTLSWVLKWAEHVRRYHFFFYNFGIRCLRCHES